MASGRPRSPWRGCPRFHCPPLRTLGFTLIEIIVVIGVIGILASFVRLAIGDGGKATKLRDSAVTLQQLVSVANQEAVFRGRPLALVFDQDHYGLQEYRDGTWQKRPSDSLFRTRTLPGGIVARVTSPERGALQALTRHSPAIFFPDGSVETLQIELLDDLGTVHAVLIPDGVGYRIKFS